MITPRVYDLLVYIGVLGFLVATLLIISHPLVLGRRMTAANPQPLSTPKSEPQILEPSNTEVPETSLDTETGNVISQLNFIAENLPINATPEIKPYSQNEITRLINPYGSESLDTTALDSATRSALVNILCEASGSLQSISGSGVIIDPKGIILTNAHIAQYFLLDNFTTANISCSIRTGSPARAMWRADVLFFPNDWMQSHAASITESRPTGTGENDFALLLISSASETPSATFPYLRVDTREGIGFVGDPALIAAYPAEFGGSRAARDSLNAITGFATIKQMMTFSENLVDMISLGSTALAQSGSSGGAVINFWGYLIGLVATTSEGETTVSRDLRAITLAHIDRSLITHTGINLETLLEKEPTEQVREFTASAKASSQVLYSEITKKQGP